MTRENWRNFNSLLAIRIAWSAAYTFLFQFMEFGASRQRSVAGSHGTVLVPWAFQTAASINLTYRNRTCPRHKKRAVATAVKMSSWVCGCALPQDLTILPACRG